MSATAAAPAMTFEEMLQALFATWRQRQVEVDLLDRDSGRWLGDFSGVVWAHWRTDDDDPDEIAVELRVPTDTSRGAGVLIFRRDRFEGAELVDFDGIPALQVLERDRALRIS